MLRESQILKNSKALYFCNRYDYSPYYEKTFDVSYSIIDYLVCEFIYKNFPVLDEGEMSKLKTLLVNKDILSESAEYLNLKQYIYIPKNKFN